MCIPAAYVFGNWLTSRLIRRLGDLTGAFGGFAVGLLDHDGPVNLALLMLGWALCGLAAQLVLFRWVLRRP